MESPKVQKVSHWLSKNFMGQGPFFPHFAMKTPRRWRFWPCFAPVFATEIRWCGSQIETTKKGHDMFLPNGGEFMVESVENHKKKQTKDSKPYLLLRHPP